MITLPSHREFQLRMEHLPIRRAMCASSPVQDESRRLGFTRPKSMWKVWRRSVLVCLVLCSGTLIAPSSTLAQPQRIGPAPPILAFPAEGRIARLSYPGNADLTFSWRAGAGGQTPTRFQVCVAGQGQACSAPSAWIFPIAGAPPITGTSYRARLPAAFQGTQPIAVSGRRPRHLQLRCAETIGMAAAAADARRAGGQCERVVATDLHD